MAVFIVVMDTVIKQGCTDTVKIELFNFFQLMYYFKRLCSDLYSDVSYDLKKQQTTHTQSLQSAV